MRRKFRAYLQFVNWGQFAYGWQMILVALAFPLTYSFVLDATFGRRDLIAIKNSTVLRTASDHSFLFNYFAYGILHLTICLLITKYSYEIFRSSAPSPLFKSYKRHHVLSFLTASTLFLLSTAFLNTSMKILSHDLIWIGLKEFQGQRLLFECVDTLWAGPGACATSFRFFFIVPLILILAAFLPASAIMQLIPHLVERIDLRDTDNLEEKLSDFLDEFEVVYYMLVGLLVSSSIATLLYLRTPFSTIDRGKSPLFSNLADATFAAWSMVYFVVLLMILIYAYSLVSRRIRFESTAKDIILRPARFQSIRTLVNVHFLVRKRSTVFLSSFAPIFTLIAKEILSS